MPPSPAEGQVPHLVPAPCLQGAYAGGRTARAPPPPTPLLPHPPRKGARTARRWRGDMGGGQGADRRAGERDRRRAIKKKHHNHEQSKPPSQRKKARTRRPKPRRTGGGRGDMGQHGTQVKYLTTAIWGPQRETPPPTAAATPCACVVLASCLRHACYKGKTTRATRGRTVAECAPPPRGHRGRVGRQRKEGVGRTTRPCPKGARAVQAPTGGPPGVRGKVG